MPLDSQRDDVYYAEQMFELAYEQPALSTVDAQALADAVRTGETWRRLGVEGQGVIVRSWNHRYSQTEMNAMVINLSEKGHIPTVVLHEMAHVITLRLYRNRIVFHGPEFVGVLRMLWREFMTVAEFKTLDTFHRQLNVRWKDLQLS